MKGRENLLIELDFLSNLLKVQIVKISSSWQLYKSCLSAVHRKLALLVSFCVRKVDFPALVLQNLYVCGKKTFGTQNLKFCCTNTGKSIFRMQNDTFFCVVYISGEIARPGASPAMKRRASFDPGLRHANISARVI